MAGDLMQLEEAYITLASVLSYCVTAGWMIEYVRERVRAWDDQRSTASLSVHIHARVLNLYIIHPVHPAVTEHGRKGDVRTFDLGPPMILHSTTINGVTTI
jgi:valyl-tRNA synthetase